MRLITRGLGGGQGNGMILQGMTEVVRIIRGGKTAAKRIYENLLDEFTIAAKLLEINGKELLAPIFNRRKYIIDESVEYTVNVKSVRLDKRKEEGNTQVQAKLLKISRGSNG
jgi:dihydrofolate reductase